MEAVHPGHQHDEPEGEGTFSNLQGHEEAEGRWSERCGQVPLERHGSSDQKELGNFGYPPDRLWLPVGTALFLLFLALLRKVFVIIRRRGRGLESQGRGKHRIVGLRPEEEKEQEVGSPFHQQASQRIAFSPHNAQALYQTRCRLANLYKGTMRTSLTAAPNQGLPRFNRLPSPAGAGGIRRPTAPAASPSGRPPTLLCPERPLPFTLGQTPTSGGFRGLSR
jgi:hypothetical protein